YDGSTGKMTQSVTGLQYNFNDASVRPHGGVAAASFELDDNVYLFNNTGQVERVISDAVSSVTGNPDLDMKLAVDGSGNLYILGTFNYAVFHYDGNGHLVNHFGSQGDGQGQLQAPSAIAVDPHGQAVYVADNKGIQAFAPDGRYLSVISVP